MMYVTHRLFDWINDPRSEAEIDADLNDEFEFHIDMRTQELCDANPQLTPEHARRLAISQFGDVRATHGVCKRIILQERNMLQRINAILMVIVLLLVVGVSLQVAITQRYNTLALQSITAELAVMKMDDAAVARLAAYKRAEGDAIAAIMESAGLLTDDPRDVARFQAALNQASLLLAQQRAEEARDDEDIRSPFEAMAWRDWTPFVLVNDQWYELLAIEGTTVKTFLDHCRAEHPGKERKRFSEDLVQIMGEMKLDAPLRVTLTLRESGAGGTIELPDVEMTTPNRVRIWQQNNDARDRGKQYPVYEEPHSSLSPDEAREDLDGLQQRLERQASYVNLKGLNIEALFRGAQQQISAGIETDAFAVVVHKLLCRMGDGHARVRKLSNSVPSGYMSCVLDDGGDRIVALNAQRDALLDEAHPYVTAIDGTDIEQWLAAAEALAPDGSSQLERHRATGLLGYVNLLRDELKLRRSPTVSIQLSDASDTHHISRVLPLAEKRLPSRAWPRRETGWLDERVGYVRLSQMSRDAPDHVHDAMQQFKDAAGLIIDVRNNGGGSRAALRALLPYLMSPDEQPQVINIAAYRLSETFSEDHLASRWLFRDNDQRWNDQERAAIRQAAQSFTPVWTPSPQRFSDWHYMVISRGNEEQIYHYDRPVAVLMDEGCFSATDIFLGALTDRDDVTLIGTASGGGSGRARSFTLPNSGLEVLVSSMASFRPDGQLYDGVGITPDVEVPRSLADLTGTTDSQLQRAVAHILIE